MPLRFDPAGFEFVAGDADASTTATERGVAADAVAEAGIAESLLTAAGFEGKTGQTATAMDGDQMVLVMGTGDEEPTAPSLRKNAASASTASSATRSARLPRAPRAKQQARPV